MRERERGRGRETTSHNIKSHRDKCMSNLNVRAKKTYKKQSTRKTNPRHKVHKQNQLTEGHFPWLPAKSPLIHSSWPKPRQIARPQAPSLKRRSVVHNLLSLVRARSLSSLSLSRSLCVRGDKRSIRVHTTVPPVHPEPLHWLLCLDGLRIFSHLRVVCLAVENCQVSFVGRKVFGTQILGDYIRGSSRVFSFFFFLFFSFFQFFNIQNLANVFPKVSEIRRFI